MARVKVKFRRRQPMADKERYFTGWYITAWLASKRRATTF